MSDRKIDLLRQAIKEYQPSRGGPGGDPSPMPKWMEQAQEFLPEEVDKVRRRYWPTSEELGVKVPDLPEGSIEKMFVDDLVERIKDGLRSRN